MLDQFLAFNWRKHPNRSFDFVGGTHLGKNSTGQRPRQHLEHTQ
jgi:hypothetical protein